MKPNSTEVHHLSAKPSITKPKKDKTLQTDRLVEDRSDDHDEIPLSNNPTPLELDIFLPWVCLQWECPTNISVKRVTQEPYYVSRKERKSVKSKNNEHKSHTSDLINDDDVVAELEDTELEDTVQITTTYDIKGTLVEIAFHKQHDVSPQVVHALSFCFPYHTNLTKFSFCDGGLTSFLLQEISKILPNSNITDLNLSGNYVPEGNYYTLLYHMSQLRCLSLSRCKLNDEACNELMAKLESGHSIVMLDFSFNCLTDEAARSIGHMLRSNRTLLHLDLSGNTITSDGAFAILASLSEFPLTDAEIRDKKRRKMLFIENKMAIYARCLEEVEKSIKKKLQSNKKNSQGGKYLKISRNNKSEKSPEEIAEGMALDIVGEFNDPFNNNETIRKKECLYCRGNFTLCSLNMSHNNLDYFSVTYIHKILKYQKEYLKPDEIGLLRIVLEGNPCPKEIPEYFEIDELLRLAVFKNTQLSKTQKVCLK